MNCWVASLLDLFRRVLKPFLVLIACPYPLHRPLSISCLQVERMAKQFKVAEDASYTCETAAHFWLLHVLARWEKFLKAVKDHGNKADSVMVDLFDLL